MNIDIKQGGSHYFPSDLSQKILQKHNWIKTLFQHGFVWSRVLLQERWSAESLLRKPWTARAYCDAIVKNATRSLYRRTQDTRKGCVWRPIPLGWYGTRGWGQNCAITSNSLHSPGSSGTWAAIDNSRQPLNHSSHESHLACLPPSVLVVPTPIQRNKSITSQWITKLLRSSRMAYMANWNLLWEKIVLRKIADRVVGI